MREIFEHKKGMTLIELLVVVALLGLMITAFSSFYFTGYGCLNQGEVNTEIQDQARISIDYIVRELREARAILKVNDGEVVFVDSQGQKTGFRVHNLVLYRDFYAHRESSVPVSSVPIAELIHYLRFSSFRENAVGVVIETSREGRSYRLQTLVTLRAAGEIWGDKV